MVLDKSKKNVVENVLVSSSSGRQAITDSMGRYSISVPAGDSLRFVYNNKPTQYFPVKDIANPEQFDISIHVSVESKYGVLKEVIVYSKSYQQDSLENRADYADVFDYRKPGFATSVGPGGNVGADVNEIINIFRFRRNKSLRAFQRRLESQEQERYVNYRFNATTVGRMTGLGSPGLDSFLVWYRPTYDFVAGSTELVFTQYVLQASYQFRRIMQLSPALKPEEK